MYKAPPEVVAEVFARVPRSLELRARSRWAEIRRRGKLAHSFLEGPSFGLHPRTRTIRSLLERNLLESFKGLNDLVFASNGDLLESETGSVLKVGLDQPGKTMFSHS